MAKRLMIKPIKVTMLIIDKTLHADHHLHSGKALSCRDEECAAIRRGGCAELDCLRTTAAPRHSRRQPEIIGARRHARPADLLLVFG
jgi:hypothetical protein